MSPVPRIGREKNEKSEIMKLADDLAAKSRILRKQAESQDAILDRLRKLGDEFANGKLSPDEPRKNSYRDAQDAIIQPLLRKAYEYLDAGDRARVEAQILISAFEQINWSGLRARLSAAHGLILKTEQEREVSPGSALYADSTRERIGRLRSAVDDLKAFVNGSDNELRQILKTGNFTPPSYPPDAQGPDGFPLAVTNVNGWMVSEHAQFRYALNQLQRVLALGPSGESIRGKIAGIKKLLGQVGEALGEDFLATGEEANS